MQKILQGSCFFIDFYVDFTKKEKQNLQWRAILHKRRTKEKCEGFHIFWNLFREERNGRN